MPFALALIIILIVGSLGFWTYGKLSTHWRRKRLLATRLAPEDSELLDHQVPLLRTLPQDLRDRLEGKVAVFRDQVEFIGCNGIEVTKEMELSIAAQASLLIVNTDVWYKHLYTILIYPDAFKSVSQKHDGYVVREVEIARSGESWQYGPVILSWAHSEQGALKTHDGHNVVLHEFAHQLDGLSGQTDGAPVLQSGQSYMKWQRVFNASFERHVKQTEIGHSTVLDAYGATLPEEFFAVAVEAFFEKPNALRHDDPDVYAQLSDLFRLDPASWHKAH